ncbi:hypothetical protein LX32DRAFT_145736 [Colletotrichum zoysiae]|uniref:Uncharacterized protein n=1 Tax=Colletotrichum zoysiae TaxID=1216348 RepID=A0AAD9H7Y2_9PEZI|nr:hypothetical protein LX32DRAFT_145736 [Colletotrichum zoysiae]
MKEGFWRHAPRGASQLHRPQTPLPPPNVVLVVMPDMVAVIPRHLPTWPFSSPVPVPVVSAATEAGGPWSSGHSLCLARCRLKHSPL